MRLWSVASGWRNVRRTNHKLLRAGPRRPQSLRVGDSFYFPRGVGRVALRRRRRGLWRPFQRRRQVLREDADCSPERTSSTNGRHVCGRPGERVDMAEDDCARLRARADTLHAEARASVTTALECGPEWNGFSAQIEIASYCEDLAEAVDARIEEQC